MLPQIGHEQPRKVVGHTPMAKTALIYMYKGCEPVETIGPADVLRRSGV